MALNAIHVVLVGAAQLDQLIILSAKEDFRHLATVTVSVHLTLVCLIHVLVQQIITKSGANTITTGDALHVLLV